MLLTNINQLEVNSFATSSKTQQYVVSFQEKHFEVSESVADLIRLLKKNTSIEDIILHLSKNKGKAYTKQNIEEIIETYINPIFEAASKQSSPFFFNRQIASAGFIHPLTNLLGYLFNPIIVIPLTVAIVSLEFFFLINTSFQFYSFISTGLNSILVFGSLYFVSVIFHELGHAAACRYYGVEHGHIGVGLYLHFPVFYADVSNIWKLKRNQRVVVDIAGIYFQSIFLIPIISIYLYTNFIILEYLIYAVTISLLFDLNPFFKFDGYWIWSDLLGIPNLRKRTVEIITYLINRLKGKTNNETPYLFKINKRERLGLVVYTVLVNIFFAYYLLYRIPIFIFHSITSAPELLDLIARSPDNKLNLIISLILQILILLLMAYFLIRVAIATFVLIKKVVL